jgi:hypothetical protein
MFTENDIIRKLYKLYFDRARYMVHNFYWFETQMDFVVISNFGYAIEFEIKTNLKDFRKDKNKLSGGLLKHDKMQNGLSVNGFYYVVPEGLEDIVSIHKKYGIITYNESGDIKVLRMHKVLHKLLPSDRMILHILERSYSNYKKIITNERSVLFLT